MLKPGDNVLFFNDVNYGSENLCKFEVESIIIKASGTYVSGLSRGTYYTNKPIENFYTSIDEFVMIKSKELSSYLKREKTFKSDAIMDLFGIPTGNSRRLNEKRYLPIKDN